MKFCKNCKYELGQYSKFCWCPKNGISLVNGEVTVRSSFHNRKDSNPVHGTNTCGTEARWYEEKDELIDKPWYMSLIPWVK